MGQQQFLRYNTPAYVRSDAPHRKTHLPTSGHYELYSFLTGRPVGSVQLQGYAKSPVPVVAENAHAITWRVIQLKNGHYILEIDGKPTTEIDNYVAVLPSKQDDNYEEWVLQPESFYAGDGEDGTFMIKNEDCTRWWSIDPIMRGPVKCFPINHQPGPTPSERLFVFKPLGHDNKPGTGHNPLYDDDQEDDYESESTSDSSAIGSDFSSESESEDKDQDDGRGNH